MQNQILCDRYNGTVRRLISGEIIPFSRNVKSERLTEVLSDIRALERERRITVTGKVLHDKAYEEQLKRLRERCSPEKETIGNLLVHADIDPDEFEEHLIKEIGESELPPLSPDTIVSILGDLIDHSQSHENNERFNRSYSTDYSQSHANSELINQSETCDTSSSLKSSASTASVLTEWVADDIIKANPNLGFRGAVSLLSHKVHPSPAFVSPHIASRINVTQSDTITQMQSILNKNQNNPSQAITKSYHAVKVPYKHDRKHIPMMSQIRHSVNYRFSSSESRPGQHIPAAHRTSFTNIMDVPENAIHVSKELETKMYTPKSVHGVKTSLCFAQTSIDQEEDLSTTVYKVACL